MKYIKKYEHLEEIKTGDIIVCVDNPYDPSDEEYETSPKVGRYYEVIEIDNIFNEWQKKNNTYITGKDIETGQIVRKFNKIYFASEMEIVTNKYNL